MNEGKGLLIKIVENKLKSLESLNQEDIKLNDIDLVDLYSDLQDSIDNLSSVTDEVIYYVLENNSKKKTLRTSIIQLRDLLIGKRDYNLQVNFTKEHNKTFEEFMVLFKDLLESKVPGIINVDQELEKCNLLIQQITRKEIINNFNFIEEVTAEYNAVDKDANLIKVMKFVNEHNLHILKTPKKNGPLLNINFIFKPKLDERLMEILSKLEIEYKELPNYLISELKKCDVDSVYETYQTIRKNKAESYGILHLIKKSNTLAKLILILYATPESVKEVVDSLKKDENTIDISLLKNVLNYTLPAFLVKKNEYFKPKNTDFINNINLLKELGVNYKALITKVPLFMIMSNDSLVYTLNYCADLGANKKTVINRLYKTFAIDPAVIIENIEVLKRYNVDITSYFEGPNYNLLKVKDLDKKIKYLETHKNLNTQDLDIELLNKMIVGKVYRECVLENRNIWSE